MLGMMSGERVKLESSASSGMEAKLQTGNSIIEGVDGISAVGKDELTILVWNYREEDVPGPVRNVRFEIAGLPKGRGMMKAEEFRVDGQSSNSYSAWQKMGSPKNPTAAQYAELGTSGRLKRIKTPTPRRTLAGTYIVALDLPQQSVSLLRLHW
jgi:xylan 1,4-beta-xylosidase